MKTMILQSEPLDEIEKMIFDFCDAVKDIDVLVFADFHCNDCFSSWNFDASETTKEQLEDELCPNCGRNNVTYYLQKF